MPQPGRCVQKLAGEVWRRVRARPCGRKWQDAAGLSYRIYGPALIRSRDADVTGLASGRARHKRQVCATLTFESAFGDLFRPAEGGVGGSGGSWDGRAPAEDAGDRKKNVRLIRPVIAINSLYRRFT